MEKTAYEILGVSDKATDEEIKKQYHTLMRYVHTNRTSLQDLSEEEKKVREYNDAYEKLRKGKRALYDGELAKQRIALKSFVQKVVGQVLMNSLNKLMKDILKGGFSFLGSYTTFANQNLKQEYWKLMSKREKLKENLKAVERDAEIEFMKTSSKNEIQLNIEFDRFASQISSLELNRNTELASVQQNYVLHASKRSVTQKKREKLRQQLEQKQMKVSRKYDMMIEKYKRKQSLNRAELVECQRKLREIVASNSEVLKVKAELEQLQVRLNSIEEQLGYQTRSLNDPINYKERSRVSV